MKNAYTILFGELGGDHSENLLVDGKIILKWISGK
jgi:hypothetical protein